MSLAAQILELQDYPQKASEEFRRQLQRARDGSLQMDDKTARAQGIDRSGELLPLPRPRLIRTLAE